MDLYEIINSIEPGVKVNIDKPFINELDNLPFFVIGKTIEELHLALETLVFLNRNADIVLDKLLLLIGARKTTFDKYFKLSGKFYEVKQDNNVIFIQLMKERGIYFNRFELLASYDQPIFNRIVKTNNTEYFKLMCKKYKKNIDRIDLSTLYITNNIEIIKHAVEVGFKFYGKPSTIGRCSFDIIKFTCDNSKLANVICISCVYYDNVEGLRYALNETVYPLKVYAYNNIEIFKLLHEKRLIKSITSSPNTLEKVKFIIENNYKCDFTHINMEIAKYLHSIGMEFDNYSCDSAAAKKDYDTMKFIVENGGKFQFGSLCYTIASNNEFEMLKYIIDNKYFLLPNNTCSRTRS